VLARIVVKHTTEKTTYFFGSAEKDYPQRRRLFIDTPRQPAAADGLQRAATRCWHSQITAANNTADFVAKALRETRMRSLLLLLLLASYFRRRCFRRCLW